PTRLLDIGLGAIPEPRLFLTAKVKERLSYLALSHCWGGVVQETLKKGNLANMRSFIPLSKLTKSVQDAIYVVQKLGYRYLWVDYLCIIQDCPMDWGQESAVMNKVYLHSTCTIAATAATDGHAGLFFQRNPCLVKPEKIRFLIGQEEFECFAIDDGLLEGEIDSAPLSKRAWVMQETTLSTRIIHFAKDQLFWTCNANQSCESFPERLPCIEGINCGTSATQKAKGIAKRRYHNNIYQEIWARMVEDYSSRHLTRPEDKGPAIQGLANEMKRHIKSPYIAGLWYSNLPLDLLWQPVGRNTRAPAASFRAPSWSWLSIDG
ncbi:HET-domain-containing protein, partial [Hyaloscypha variabilis F]